MRRRRTWIILAAFVGVALAVYFEPTRCVRGWLHGEAFFDGRPTSAWRGEIERQMRLEPDELVGEFLGPGREGWWQALGRHIGVRSERVKLEQLLTDDAALPVLDELGDDPSPRVREFARVLIEAKAKDMHGIDSQPEAGLFITSWAIFSKDGFSEWLCCCVALRKCRVMAEE